MGEGLRLKFSFKGAYSTTTDDASLPAVVDTASLPPTFLGAQLTVHANAALAYEGFDFSKGNVLSKRIDAAAQNGLKGYWITAHKPMIKVNPEMVLIGTFDAYTKWRAGTTGNFQTAVLGVTAGNRFQLICGRTQISDIGHGEREGARTYDLSLNVSTAANAVDGDDYSLVIT
jgi:hypothetical protein